MMSLSNLAPGVDTISWLSTQISNDVIIQTQKFSSPPFSWWGGVEEKQSEKPNRLKLVFGEVDHLMPGLNAGR
jgi:hypothetical protein